MSPVPHVVDARYLRGYVLELTFNDGSIREVDFWPYIDKGGVFEPLREADYFRRFFIDLNTVCWPNGADVAPERLYEIGVSKHDAA